MNAKELKMEIANKLNYKFNEQFKIVHGESEGYTCLICPMDAYETTYNVIFCVSKDGSTLNKNDFASLKKDNQSIANVNVNKNRLIVVAKSSRKPEEKIDNVVEVNNIVTTFLKENGYQNIDETTKEVTTTNICNIKGIPQFVSLNNFEKLKSENTGDNVIKKEENVVKGIIGGLLGSLAGVLAIVLIGQMGYIAVISGIAMGACTILLYHKFAGSISTKGIIISIIIMAIMTYIGVRLSASITVYKELSKYGHYDFIKVFENLSNYINLDKQIQGAYMKDMILTFLFTGLGAFSIIKAKFGEIKNSDVYEVL